MVTAHVTFYYLKEEHRAKYMSIFLVSDNINKQSSSPTAPYSRETSLTVCYRIDVSAHVQKNTKTNKR